MITSAGIDLGSHVIHVGIINDRREVIAANHIMIDKLHTPSDLIGVLDELTKFLSANYVDQIVVEKPLVFQGGGFPVLRMVELYTLVKLAAYRIGATIKEVTPSQWRKKVLGKGNANKTEAIEFVKGLGWETSDHNEGEAICIGLYT